MGTTSSSIIVSHSSLSDPVLMKEVEDFFHRHTRRSFGAKNILFQARDQGELIGLVRLCFEENQHILRSMELKKEYQRRGIGSRLLLAFETYVNEQSYNPVYCLPYDHLCDFYGKIGFKKIDDDELPPFLKLRLQAYRRKRPESQFCGMIRNLVKVS